MTDSSATLAPKPWISGIAPYVPGKSAGADGRPVVKLSANENPLGTGDKARAAFLAAAGDLSRYPDPGAAALREAIAAKFGLDPARPAAGDGSVAPAAGSAPDARNNHPANRVALRNGRCM